MSLLIAFGVLAGVMSWISGPAGPALDGQRGQLPEFMKKDQQERRPGQHPGDPRLYRLGALVAVHRDERRKRRLFSY